MMHHGAIFAHWMDLPADAHLHDAAPVGDGCVVTELVVVDSRTPLVNRCDVTGSGVPMSAADPPAIGCWVTRYLVLGRHAA